MLSNLKQFLIITDPHCCYKVIRKTVDLIFSYGVNNMHALQAMVRAVQILNRAQLDDALGTRWALLMVAGLNELRKSYPRHPGDELIISDINWSAVLGVSGFGLEQIAEISNHANAWLEEAGRYGEILDAFPSWYGFIGTNEQKLIDQAIRHGQLSIRYGRNKSLCAYQIYQDIMESDSAAAFNAALRSAGYSFKPLTQAAFEELLFALNIQASSSAYLSGNISQVSGERQSADNSSSRMFPNSRGR
jgi:hypothetical protein